MWEPDDRVSWIGFQCELAGLRGRAGGHASHDISLGASVAVHVDPMARILTRMLFSLFADPFGRDKASQKLQTTLTSEIARACQEFVRLVQSIEGVMEVRLLEGEGGATICTIIDAPPGEAGLRQEIYRAELGVLWTSTGPLLDFDLINVRELPSDYSLQDDLAGSAVLWRRS